MGVLKRWNGSSWDEVTIKNYSGTSFDEGQLKRYDGSQWIDVGKSLRFTSSFPLNPVTNRRHFHTPSSLSTIRFGRINYIIVGAIRNRYDRDNVPSNFSTGNISWPGSSTVTLRGRVVRTGTFRADGSTFFSSLSIVTFNRAPATGSPRYFCSRENEWVADRSTSINNLGSALSESGRLAIAADYLLDDGVYENIGYTLPLGFINNYPTYQYGFSIGITYRSNGTNWIRV